MKLHGGPNLARGPEFDTHALNGAIMVCYQNACKIEGSIYTQTITVSENGRGLTSYY